MHPTDQGELRDLSAFDILVTNTRRPPAQVERQALQVLQRAIGNSAVRDRLGAQSGKSAGTLAGPVGFVSVPSHAVQRDGPQVTDPSVETPPKQADLADSAKDLLLKYAEKYLGKLGDEAKKRLVEAWDASPTGVIAAGAVVGGAGITYLLTSKSDMPGLPDIPLDILGGPFVGATMKLEIKGPLTSPESFGFKLTFKEQGKRKKHVPTDAPPNIYDFANPEAIALEVDGPEFETEVPDAGPDSNIRGENLANLVRVVGNGMLAGVKNKETKPYVDLGELPPTPAGFAEGLKRIVDALVKAAPGTLGKIEQVNFRVFRGGKLRFIPIRPSPPQSESEATGTPAP